MTLSRLVSTIQQLTKICRKLKTKIFNSLIPTRPQRPWHVSDYTSEFQNINKGQSNLAKGGIARLMTSITVHSLSISSTIFARWQHALRSWPWCQWCVRLGPPFSGKMRSSLTVSMGRAKGLQKNDNGAFRQSRHDFYQPDVSVTIASQLLPMYQHSLWVTCATWPHVSRDL